MTTDVLSDTDVSLKVVSNASGRMRVCVTGFNVDAVRAVAIEETVSQVTGVHAVHAYPRTASVVIWYSPELGDTAAVSGRCPTHARTRRASSSRHAAPSCSSSTSLRRQEFASRGVGETANVARFDSLGSPPPVGWDTMNG